MIEWAFRVISFFSIPAKTGHPEIDEYTSCPRKIAIALIAAFAFICVANIFLPENAITPADGIQFVLNGIWRYVALAAAILGSVCCVSALWFFYRWIRLRWLLGATD